MGGRARLQDVFRLLLVCWSTLGSAPAQVRHPLPVLWMMPVGSRGENLTAALAPALRLALKDLEEQAPPLGNYEIQIQLLEAQCDPAEALKALFDTMWAGPRYLLLLGGACPPVTSLIARSLPPLDLLQVSFEASSPVLSNRKWFGNLFSTLPSDRALNQAVVKLLQRYRWSRVGVVTQDGARLSEMKKDLFKQLQKADLHVAAAESLSEDVCSSVKRLKEKDIRIIIGQFEDDVVSEIFCCAYRLNLFGPRYQWIVAAGGTSGWRLGWHFSGCSVNSLLTAADGSIKLQIRQLGTTNTPGVSGRTPQDYQDSYFRQLTEERSEVNPLHAFAYDAVWVAARALSRVMEALKHREKYSAERNVTVSEEEVEKMLLEAVKSTEFEGVTGPVFFRNGERMTILELVQFQESGGVLVGDFNTSNRHLRLMNHLLKFKGPGPARDQTLVLLQQRHVSLLLYSVMSSAAAVIIIVSLIVLCFVLVGHKRPSSSRPLTSGSGSQDELLLLGIVLCSSSVLFSGLDGASLSDWTFDIFCSARLWTLSLGHTLGFSVLFARTWRIYFLCRVNHKRCLKPARLVLLWLFLLDVLVLTSWQILDPLRRAVLHHSTESDSADQDIIIRPFCEHCSSINMELWTTALYGYKAPLMGLGSFLSWSIRPPEVGAVALSRDLPTLSVFVVTLFSVTGALASLLTSHNPPLQFCLSGIFILCCSVFILSTMFTPKILLVRWNDSELQGEAAGEDEDDGDDEDGDELSRLNQQLKSRTEQLDIEIETITLQLQETFQFTTENHAGIRSNEFLGQDTINSPEQVRRRLSVQLPILHHSYMPAVGGISSSCSSLFSSQDVFIHLHDTSCSAQPIREQQ
ncbi:gamma-aminobutyric acid type B receptor subunit 2-like [Mugil cephalus]|uniref:gamma-aminobutyric acid type B receptor subunit 2-like n=1 Tax=Mugil cephalus TaxID=48193 RepID=UPI001FB6255C|nr:gamma-aminobutyric acid type B receptor subunit 2-like [Mugil cephalus]